MGPVWFHNGMPAAPRERNELSEAVAAQIRAERSAARLSIQATADKSKIPYGTYKKLDDGTGIPDAAQLGRLCRRVYGISLSEFFARVERRLATQGNGANSHTG